MSQGNAEPENNARSKKSFWYYIFKLHLYTTKSESLLKASILTISWIGSIRVNANVVAYYLFSISIIMEYIIQLIRARRFIPKILPFLLTVSNGIVFFISTWQLIAPSTITLPLQYNVELCTLAVIWIDTVLILLIEMPDECKVESNLGSVEVAAGGRNGK